MPQNKTLNKKLLINALKIYKSKQNKNNFNQIKKTLNWLLSDKTF